MSLFKGKFTSTRQDWETPGSLFSPLDEEFGFTLDLAANKKNKKCSQYFSKEDDALKQNWDGVCWLNPPYGGAGRNSLSAWVRKASDEAGKNNSTIVMLIPARTNTNWWHKYCENAHEVRFIKGRPKFIGATHGLPQPLAIVIFK